jgi:Uma2 family endonuclease
MATETTINLAPGIAGISPAERIPPLESGDHLSLAEFRRRYEAMPRLKKAELISGVVFVQAPVSAFHSDPHADLITWLGNYRAATPGVAGGDNGTVQLGPDSEPQPDACLRLDAAFGGQSRINADGYVEGVPELAAEVAATTASYDLHIKLDMYLKHGVREYLVWRVYDKDLDWFVLRDGKYERLQPGDDGICRSEVFPGLWLDKAALLGGDLAAVLRQVQVGTASPEHAEFVARLKVAAEETRSQRK